MAVSSESTEVLDLARLQFALTAGGHFLFVALTLGLATVVACIQTRAISAYHLFRRSPEWELFGSGLRTGVFLSLPALFVTAAFGGVQLASLATLQPMKSAVFGQKKAEIAEIQADMVARFGPGDYVPSEAWTRGGAVVMLLCFALMMYLVLPGFVMALFRTAVYRFRAWHVVLIAAVPLPYVAMISGWVFREAGRQPWVVYGLLTTEDAVSSLSPGAMRASLITFTTLFALLAALNGWLLVRFARRGPVDDGLGHDDRTDSGDDGGDAAGSLAAPSY
ncbi:cytochrome ubiquinol oxidase subunit I [Streptomyces sp. NPDC001970]